MLFSFLLSFAISTVWLNPATDLSYNINQNQGFQKEIGKSYYRFPPRAQSIVRESVWEISRYSSSITLKFVTNSPKIQIKYELEKFESFPMMTTLGTSGIELYGFDCNGTIHFFAGEYTYNNPITVKFDGLNKSVLFTYFLTLPSFSVVKPSTLLIGYEDSSFFLPVQSELERPIVVYGSSIAQGSSASRAGLAWPTWLSRDLLLPVRNFGLGETGKLDSSEVDLITEEEACAYVIDCMSSFVNESAEEVSRAILSAYDRIRARWPVTPIILTEFGGFANDEFICEYSKLSEKMSIAFGMIKESLLPSADANLHFVTKQQLQFDSDDMSDVFHPNDNAMRKQKEVIASLLRTILHTPLNNDTYPYTTQLPVIHHRVEQFLNRHREILEQNMNLSSSPDRFYNAIIGDSITEYWIKKNYSSWKLIMEKNNYINMGSRGDRVENVLYRIYHDEIYSNYVKFNKIVVLLGTNNLVVEENDNVQIVEGLRFLMRCVLERQPQAKIIMLGVFPRDDYDDRIKDMNRLIEKMAGEEGWGFSNPGLQLLDKDTGYINKKLFLDGLHPNNEGYEIVAPLIGAL